MTKPISTLSELYQYLDSLFDQETCSDTLFASGYLRGFISLSATEFGGEQQEISTILIQTITDNVAQAKMELSPQDNAIVQNFWTELQQLVSIPITLQDAR